MNHNTKRILPNNVKTRIKYTGKQLSTKFQIKDVTKNQHEDDLIYYSKCLGPSCNADYLGKTGRIIVLNFKDLKFIDKIYHGNKSKWKIQKLSLAETIAECTGPFSTIETF